MALEWGRLGDLVKNVKRLSISDGLLFVFSMEHVQLFAIELNTGSPNNSEYGQLFLHGIDAEGVNLERIGGGYAPITEEIKQFQGIPFDRVTLYDTGKFYRSFEFIQQGDGFILRADTSKEGEDLTERWGDNIIGLNDESIAKLNQEVLPEIIEYILREVLQ
jgi:hypothetical protein